MHDGVTPTSNIMGEMVIEWLTTEGADLTALMGAGVVLATAGAGGELWLSLSMLSLALSLLLRCSIRDGTFTRLVKLLRQMTSKTDIPNSSMARMVAKALIICFVIFVLIIFRVDNSVILYVLDYLLTYLLYTAPMLGSCLIGMLGLVPM